MLFRSGRVVAGIEPQFPAVRQPVDERAAAQSLQAARPVDGGEAGGDMRVLEREAVEALEAGDGHGRAVDLVAAGSRQVGRASCRESV